MAPPAPTGPARGLWKSHTKQGARSLRSYDGRNKEKGVMMHQKLIKDLAYWVVDLI